MPCSSAGESPPPSAAAPSVESALPDRGLRGPSDGSEKEYEEEEEVTTGLVNGGFKESLFGFNVTPAADPKRAAELLKPGVDSLFSVREALLFREALIEGRAAEPVVAPRT